MQVKSRERVANHGEVYTSEREVNAMLDLVFDQVNNHEKTFLEPACGTGNFLAVILQRRLDLLYQKHKKIQYYYELNAIIAISSLYGIELLADNVTECRERLLDLFVTHYTTHFKKTNPRCVDVARFLLSKNILCADALSLRQADGAPIVFSQWKFTSAQVKRRTYVYDVLINQYEHDLFGVSAEVLVTRTDEPTPQDGKIFLPQKEYPAVHFLELDRE